MTPQHTEIDYLTGERFQTLADFHWKPANRENPYDSGGSPDLPDKNCVVYCCGDYIAEVFDAIRAKPHNKYVLLTHNSDVNVHIGHTAYCPENIVRWYGQNMNVPAGGRFIGVPIGIANSKWPHGNMDELYATQRLKTALESFAYLCIKIETNPAVRRRWYNHCKSLHSLNIKVADWPTPRSEYLTSIHSTMFSICPPGNGVDTHRVWESFFLNKPCIVQDAPWLDHFTELPFVRVQSSDHITKDFLIGALDVYKRADLRFDKMYMKYWQELIAKDAKELL